MRDEPTTAVHCLPRNLLVCFIFRSYCHSGFECKNGGYCIDLTHCVCPPHYSGEIVIPRQPTVSSSQPKTPANNQKINRSSLSTDVFFLWVIFLRARERARSKKATTKRARWVLVRSYPPRLIFCLRSRRTQDKTKGLDRLQQIKQTI